MQTSWPWQHFQQLCNSDIRPWRFCFVLFPLVAAKHTAQYSTSQPPLKSPGETGDDVVLLHLVFPFFVVFIGKRVPPVTSFYSLHCSAAAAFALWPSPPAEETQLSLTMHKRTHCPYTTGTRWIHLKIVLEVKLCSAQEWLTVRQNRTRHWNKIFPHLTSDQFKKIKSLSVTLTPNVCFSAGSKNSERINNLFSTGWLTHLKCVLHVSFKNLITGSIFMPHVYVL